MLQVRLQDTPIGTLITRGECDPAALRRLEAQVLDVIKTHVSPDVVYVSVNLQVELLMIVARDAPTPAASPEQKSVPEEEAIEAKATVVTAESLFGLPSMDIKTGERKKGEA